MQARSASDLILKNSRLKMEQISEFISKNVRIQTSPKAHIAWPSTVLCSQNFMSTVLLSNKNSKTESEFSANEYLRLAQVDYEFNAYEYTHILMHVCMYIYIYIYTHTHKYVCVCVCVAKQHGKSDFSANKYLRLAQVDYEFNEYKYTYEYTHTYAYIYSCTCIYIFGDHSETAQYDSVLCSKKSLRLAIYTYTYTYAYTCASYMYILRTSLADAHSNKPLYTRI